MRTLARASDTADLLRRIRTLRPDSPRQWGRMSAHQMVCHLNDAFRMASGEKPVAHVSTLARRTLLKWVALHLPRRWPPGISTVPEVDQEIGGTRPAEFGADLAELERHVREFARRHPASRPPHPIFGPLSERQWLRWSYLHTDHHLRQFGA